MRGFVMRIKIIGAPVRLHIPEPTPDRSELKLKQAEIAINGKRPSLSINELRERLDAEGLDEKGIEELIELHERLTPKAAGFEAAMEIASEITLKRETAKKVEQSLESEVEDAAKELSKDIIKALEENEEK
ncbi:unnamed protein product [marine sediment metagenome]|uniref:Uncharacterized protein n=1 Tax=marine sediment metagenome TaxID=412755 RepID=X1JRB1_9ZZZZ